MEQTSIVKHSLTLLEQIAGQTEMLLENMEPAEQDKVMKSLDHLARSAAWESSTEQELLRNASSVCRLVEDTPTLASLILAREAPLATTSPQARVTFRGITTTQDDKFYRKSRHVQEQAAQIRNRVAECEKRLRLALQRPSGSGEQQ